MGLFGPRPAAKVNAEAKGKAKVDAEAKASTSNLAVKTKTKREEAKASKLAVKTKKQAVVKKKRCHAYVDLPYQYGAKGNAARIFNGTVKYRADIPNQFETYKTCGIKNGVAYKPGDPKMGQWVILEDALANCPEEGKKILRDLKFEYVDPEHAELEFVCWE